MIDSDESEEEVSRPVPRPKQPRKKPAPKKSTTANRRSMMVVLKFSDKAMLSMVSDATKTAKVKVSRKGAKGATQQRAGQLTTPAALRKQQSNKKATVKTTTDDRSHKRKRVETNSENETKSDFDDDSRSETPDLDAPYYKDHTFKKPHVDIPPVSLRRITRSQATAQATQQANAAQPPAPRDSGAVKRPAAKKAKTQGQIGGKILPAQPQKGRPQMGGKRMPAMAGSAT